MSPNTPKIKGFLLKGCPLTMAQETHRQLNDYSVFLAEMNVTSDRCDASQQLHNELQLPLGLLPSEIPKIATSLKRYQKRPIFFGRAASICPILKFLRNYQEVTLSNLYLNPFFASHLPRGIFNHG